MDEKQTRTVRLSIDLPMEFPAWWTDDDIEFYLNESSYCLSNVLDAARRYEKGDGCICFISEAHLVEKK